METPRFGYYSLWEMSMLLILRFLALAGLFYFGANFNENPPVLGILILVYFLVLVFFGDSHIRIYSDRLEIRDYSIWNLLRGKRKIIPLQSLERAYLDEPVTEKPDPATLGLFILLLFLVPRKSGSARKRTPVYLEFRDGISETIFYTEYYDDASQIAEAINRQLQPNSRHFKSRDATS